MVPVTDRHKPLCAYPTTHVFMSTCWLYVQVCATRCECAHACMQVPKMHKGMWWAKVPG